MPIAYLKRLSTWGLISLISWRSVSKRAKFYDWSLEDLTKEIELIKEKKSELSSMDRNRIAIRYLRKYRDKHGHYPGEKSIEG